MQGRCIAAAAAACYLPTTLTRTRHSLPPRLPPQDYRENRKFSLQVRDMVAVGQVEEAQQLAAQQMDEMMARLSSDSAFRSE